MLFSSNGARFANPNFLQFNATLVAGGASGGGTFGEIYASGGGGAGGVLILNNLNFLRDLIITVTVGAGGAAPGRFKVGTNGSNSIIEIGYNYTAIGGGGGGGNGANNPSTSALAGGSGGGQSINGGANLRPNALGGVGTAGQGNNGGACSTVTSTAGGGGGYSSAGGDASTSASGVGGTGYSSTLSYTGKTYAIGGDGALVSGPTPGTVNTGNGGDGVFGLALENGLAGGSGAVLIYVPTGLTFNLISGTVNTYALAGYDSVKEFITSGQFSLS